MGKMQIDTKSNRAELLHFLFVVALMFSCTISPVCAEENKNLSLYSSETCAKITERQNRLKDEIARVKAAIDLETSQETGSVVSVLEQKLAAYRKIDFIYEQQLLQLKSTVDLKQILKRLKDELSTLADRQPPEKSPDTFLYLDELEEKQILLQMQDESVESAIHTVEESLRAAEDKLKTANQNYRHIAEKTESKMQDKPASPALILAELAVRLAEEEVCYQKAILENNKIHREIHYLRQEVVRRKISLVEPHVRFTLKELQNKIVGIEKAALTFKKRLKRAKTKKEFFDARVINTKVQLKKNVRDPSQRQKKEQEVLTWEIIRDTHMIEQEVLNRCLRNLNDKKSIWQNRYALFHNINRADLAGWRLKAEQAIEQFEREKQLLSIRQAECRNEILALEKEFKAAKEKATITWHLEEQLQSLKGRESLFEEALQNIRSTHRTYVKFGEEIEKTEKRKSLPQYIFGLFHVVYPYWHYELTTVDDRPITVEKITLALVFLIVGFFLSNFLTTKMAKRINRRFGLDVAATFAIQKISYYLLLVLIMFFVLHMVRIPLTFFTVIGGALAIGVGFGSQDIVNNFLSGLILMLERPAKIGDIVDVENIYGTVEYVGARSTRIKTFDNLRLVVPNSTLLQSKLINWNLSDDIVRREICVGVQYGTPTRKTAGLIWQAVNENTLVEKDPQPTVLLYDFGDNALIFKTLIWISMSKTGMAHQDILRVESEIRFRIDELFRQNEIVIAFPQRDVHVDTLRPLEIKIKQDESFQK